MAGRPESLEPLEKALGHRFVREDLLRQALTHSSTARSAKARTLSNQRQEFLGDRVIGLAVAELLFAQFPDEDEGALARRHAALVCREALAQVADGISLAPHIIMSAGEEGAGGRANPSLLADTLEAVIAALYMDGGLPAAERFIARYWQPLIDAELSPPKDAKTALQEWAQGRGLALPVYQVTGRSGPPHAPLFSVEVSLEDGSAVTASGSNKRTAERDAAQALLQILGVETGGNGE
jgi:ribonuclease-3